MDGLDPSVAATNKEGLTFTKLLEELIQNNTTPTNDHSQNYEMVRTTGRNSVEADDQPKTKEVGPDENTERVMQLYSLTM